MTKRQRRLMYLEVARAVLEEGRDGVFSAVHDPGFNSDELGDVCRQEDGKIMHGAILRRLPADERAMLLILAAII